MIRAGLLVLSVALLAAAPASQTRPAPPPGTDLARARHPR